MNSMLKLTLYFALAGMAFGELYGRPQFADPAPWPDAATVTAEKGNGAPLVYSEDAREDAAAFSPAVFRLHYLGGSSDKEIKSVTVNNGILELVKPAAMYSVDFCMGAELYSDYAMAPHDMVGQNAEKIFAQFHKNGYMVHRAMEQISGKKAVWVEEHLAFRWKQKGEYVIAFALSPWLFLDASTGNIEKVQAQEWAYVTLSPAAYHALQAVARYYTERHALHITGRNGTHGYEENIQVREFPSTVEYRLPLLSHP